MASCAGPGMAVTAMLVALSFAAVAEVVHGRLDLPSLASLTSRTNRERE